MIPMETEEPMATKEIVRLKTKEQLEYYLATYQHIYFKAKLRACACFTQTSLEAQLTNQTNLRRFIN